MSAGGNTSSSSSVYIYYKVAPAHAASLMDATHAMQAQLRQSMPGLVASLHERQDARQESSDDTEAFTWMETYHFNGHADQRAWAQFETALAGLLVQLPSGTVSPRHTEYFQKLQAPQHGL